MNVTDDGRHLHVSPEDLKPDSVTPVSNVRCPECAVIGTLQIETRMTVVGLAPVAGFMLKASASEAPWLVCTNCEFKSVGKR